MNKTQSILMSIVVALACALAGCGGSGSHHVGTAASSSGDGNAASGQVAAAVFVQQWSEILWGVVTNQTGTQTPSITDPVPNPDGQSFSSNLTAADGTTAVITTFLDGSARVDIIRPDGSTQTVTSSAPAWDGGTKVTTDWSVTSSNGLTVTYTSVVDDQGTWWDMADDTTQLAGTSTLPGGISQTFDVLTVAGQTTVQSVQSDGSTFTLSVPLTSPDFMPDYSRDATGTYVGPGCNIAFTLKNVQVSPARWSVMASNLGQTTGDFSINNDFSGYGQFQETGAGGQKLSAVLTWQQDGESQINYLSGQTRQTQPAGAAVDYLTHRWQTLAALMGPAPGP